MAERSHVLYRFYTSTGQLLYVGVTMNPPQRFSSHRDEKTWWSTVSGITVESYSSREDLLAAERRAIQVERPQYNIVHSKKADAPRRLAAVPLKSPPKKIRYRCGVCGNRVDNGYIHVSYTAIDIHQRAWNEWQRRQRELNEDQVPIGGFGVYRAIPASELLSANLDEARWMVHHPGCDPDPDGDDYHFDVNRADTTEKLLSWTAHLLGKSWIQDTNWSQFLYSVLSQEAACV